jgi:GWxTD domain-containing protein
MKTLTAVTVVLALCLSLPAVSEKELISKLPPRHRKWLSEEVVYIITPVEKDVFLKLETDRERDTFINAFWKQRNPNPNLPENEFKKEHYRRIDYANQWFGRDSPGPGWRTEMGRIYIILGEPRSIDRFDSVNELVPTIIWFYQGMGQYGLPDSFSVVFFKQDGMGDYVLYSPIRFGPTALMRNYAGDQQNYLAGYSALSEIEPQVAAISMSLIAGDPLTNNPSLASEMLVKEKIPQLPQRKINSIYASNFLKFKGQIEIDYADNYVESSSQLNVVRDPSGHYFIHYLIEPKRLSLEEHKGRYYATLELSGNISERSGKMLTQISRRVPIDLSPDRMRIVKDKLFSFQDMVPVIAGNHRITVFLKNLASKEFSSMDREFVIPEKDELGISPLLLANRRSHAAGLAVYKPFLFRGSHLLPSPRNDFLASDELIVFFQVYGLNPELAERGSLEFSLSRREERVFHKLISLGELPGLPDVIEALPLKGYPPAYYSIKVALLDKDKRELLAASGDFYITPQPHLPRPWVVSVATAAGDFPVFLNELGRQHLQRRELERALPLLEEAFRRNPGHARFGLDYCQLLLQKNDFAMAKSIALPRVKEKSLFEFCLPLGQACQGLGEFAEAIVQYAEYITHFGANVNVFNAIGECYSRLGDRAEALKAWEKSLSLNPKQPRIKEKVDDLKKNSNESVK